MGAKTPDSQETSQTASNEAGETAFDLNFCLTPGQIQGQHIFLDGPWFQPLEIGGYLLFGRDADLPQEIRQSLQTRYDNVSRRHAELRCERDGVWVTDLGSSNGTFVNEVRLEPGRPVRLAEGARLRFAADLVVTLRIEKPAG